MYSCVLPIIYAESQNSFVLLWTCVAELFFVKTSHFSRNSLLVWADHPPAPVLSSLVMFVMTQYCCNQKLNAAAQIFAMSSHSRQLLFKDLVGGRYEQNLSNKEGIVIYNIEFLSTQHRSWNSFDFSEELLFVHFVRKIFEIIQKQILRSLCLQIFQVYETGIIDNQKNAKIHD